MEKTGHPKCRQRGATLVIVAVALVALLGIVTLTVDVGRLAIAAQQAQIAADAAALAGASELPSVSDATGEVALYIEANNEGTHGFQVALKPGEGCTYYGPGETVPGYGDLPADTHALEVNTQIQVDYIFGSVLGFDTTTVTKSAVAIRRAASSSPYAIFAGEDSPTDTVFRDLGSGLYVDGSIHANGRVMMNGGNDTVTGVLEYVGSYQINGPNIDIQGGIVESTVLPYPVDYQWDDFETDSTLDSITVNDSGATLPSGRIHVLGDLTVNGSGSLAENSLYKVEGNVTFNGTGHILNNVTIVAQGKITFNGCAQTITPFIEGITLVSYQTTSGSAITFNGSNQQSNGVMFAPNGGIVFNGASSQVQNGSIIGKTVRLNGSNFTVIGTVSGGESSGANIGLIL